MRLLKQSTAATVKVGPVLDPAGAIYTGLTAADLTLTRNGTDVILSTDDAAATVTSTGNGLYAVGLTATNTAAANRLSLTCTKATYAMPPSHFTVLPAATFDALVTNAAGGASGLPLLDGSAHLLAYSVAQAVILPTGTGAGQISLSGGKVAATLLKSDTAGFNDVAATAIVSNGAITTSGGAVSTVTNLSNAVTLPAAPTDWLTAAAVKADAVTKIQSGLATATALSAIPTDPLTSLGTTAPAGWLNAAAFAATALNGKGDWSTFNPATTAVVLSGSLGWGGAPLPTIGTSTLTTGDLTTAIAPVKAKTDSLTFSVAGKIDANVLDVLGAAATASTINVDGAGNAVAVLAATGLDAVSMAPEADGGSTTGDTTLPKMIRRLWRRHFRPASKTATTLSLKNNAGTVISTQAITDDGAGAETQAAAT